MRIRNALSIGLLCVSSVLSSSLLAAGPTHVATIDRGLWPHHIHSAQMFDQASEAEILSFTAVLAQTPLATKSAIQTLTRTKRVNLTSVALWKTVTERRLLAAFQYASHSNQITTWNGLVAYSHQHLPTYDATWFKASQAFYHTYLYEQVRLAALFPRITSEIAALTDNEVSGFDLKDGQYLLSFDDGPHPVNTPKVISKLHQYHANAWFFVLGNKLQHEQQTSLYRDQCLGTHGWTHVPHTNLASAMASITKSEQLIAHYSSQNPIVYFRPPFGQRSFMLSHVLAKANKKVVLWNIDSQDWNRDVTSRQIRDRVITLMLLWRKGIILFHDAYPKANMILDDVNDVMTESGHHWSPCSTIIPVTQ